MAIALMTAVWKLDLTPSDKMVLLALADAANDQGVTWMAVRHRNADDSRLDLLTKCSLSERAVQGALKRLCEAGLLSRKDVPGKGVIWTVTPAASAPPQEMRPAGNDVNPRSKCGETVSNHHISEAKASSIGRELVVKPLAKPKSPKLNFVPDDWQPRSSHAEKAQTLGLDLRAEIERFRLHEFKAPKTDFDRAFHAWLINAPKYGPRHAKPDQQTARLDNFRAAWTGADGAAEMLAARRTF